MKVNILGTDYEITEETKDKNKILERADGYCDNSVKKIVIEQNMEGNIENMEYYKKKVIRHEIVHAFFNESGLKENYEHPNRFGIDETVVDWIAIQFPKMLKAFKEADCL